VIRWGLVLVFVGAGRLQAAFSFFICTLAVCLFVGFFTLHTACSTLRPSLDFLFSQIPSLLRNRPAVDAEIGPGSQGSGRTGSVLGATTEPRMTLPNSATWATPRDSVLLWSCAPLRGLSMSEQICSPRNSGVLKRASLLKIRMDTVFACPVIGRPCVDPFSHVHSGHSLCSRSIL